MSARTDESEAQGLLPARPEGCAEEEPRRCGSHIDKICLFPFLLALGALGFFGLKGWNDFELFLKGNEQAIEACAPLEDLDQQCSGKLVVNAQLAAGRVDDAGDKVTHAWRNVTTSIIVPVEDACDSLTGGVANCSAEVSKLQDAFGGLLAPPPHSNDPALHGDCDEDAIEEVGKEMLENTTSYVSRVDAVCTKVLDAAGDLCQHLAATSEAQVDQLRRAVNALSGDALDTVQVEALGALNTSSNEVCPPLESLPSGCKSIRHSLRDAFASAVEAALAQLPANVPAEPLEAALDSISEKAVGVVDKKCKAILSISDDCASQIFGEDTWHPLINKVTDPLVELRLKLQGIIDDVNSSGTSGCNRPSYQGDEMYALGEYAGHALFRSKLKAANESVLALAETFATAAGDVVAPCKALKNSTSAVESQLGLLTDSLEPIEGVSGQLEDCCDELISVHDGCVTAANPMAVLTEGSTGLWQRKSFEIMKLEAYLIGVGSVLVLMLLVMIKCAVMTLIKLSIFLNLAAVFSMIVFNLAILDTIMALFFAGIFVFKCVWFKCLWSRMEYAGALIQCGVDAIERKLGFLVWLLGILVLFLQAGVLAMSFLALYHFTGPNPPEMELELPPFVIGGLIVFAMAWGVEAFSDALHVTICCLLGSVCGVKTPASSCPMATLFAFTGALGSVAAGAFWVAVLKALEYVYDQITKSKNAVVQVIGRCVCMAFQWAIQMFNSYAFVYVGMKGMSYCDAAKRTALEMSRNGMAAVAANQALHSVVKVARMVVTYSSCLVSLYAGYHLQVITSEGTWQEIVAAPFLCLGLAMLTSYGLSLTLGRLLEAATCTLFIVFDTGDYNEAMREALPRVYAHLESHVPKDDDDDCC